MPVVGYFDPDGDGENFDEMQKKALMPKTPLQRQAFTVTHRKYFDNVAQRKAFVALEDTCRGETEEEYLQRCWFENCIKYAEILNKKAVTVKLFGLIRYMQNEQKREAWLDKNRNRLLKERKTAGLQSLGIDRPVKEEDGCGY